MPISVPDSDRCNPDSSQVLSEALHPLQEFNAMQTRIREQQQRVRTFPTLSLHLLVLLPQCVN